MAATINTTLTATYTLSNVGTQNPLTVTSLGLVDVYNGNAIYGTNAAAWDIVNAGTIENSGTSAAAGVSLLSGGTIVNQNLIESDNGSAVAILGAAGTVVNYGTIVHTGSGTHGEAVYLAAGGLVTNYGLLSGSRPGTATSGSPGVVEANNTPATVVNLGTITNPNNASGVNLLHGGLLVNGATNNTSASIVAPRNGIYMGGKLGTAYPGAVGTVVNYGTIASTITGSIVASGVVFAAGGTVGNFGLITSVEGAGVAFLAGGAGTIVNHGTITHTGNGTRGEAIYFGAGGIVTNYGLLSGTRPGSSTSGYPGVVEAHNTPATVVNLGTITSPGISNGVNLLQGGLLVNGATNNTSASVIAPHAGVYMGGKSGTAYPGAVGTVVNYGTIAAGSQHAVFLRSGGTVHNAGTITAATSNSGVFVDNAYGLVTNAGLIENSDGNAVHVATGAVVNQAGAHIVGGTAGNGVVIGTPGTGETYAGAGTITNFGTIANASTANGAVDLADGGTVTNGSTAAPAALIIGPAVAVSLKNVAGTVANYGTIASTATAAAAGFAGVKLSAGGTIVNQGTIDGAANPGILLSGTVSAAVSNVGIVTGATGIYIDSADNAGNTLVNFGTIVGTGGTAVSFADPSDELVIEAGSTLVGAIGNMQSGDTIDLPFLTFVNSATISAGANNILQVVEGTASYAVQLDPAQNFTGLAFTLSNDGNGGTLVGEEIAPPDTVTATNQSVAYQQTLPLSSIFAVSGPTPTNFNVWLDGPADGLVTDGSGAIPTNTAVSETSLNNVSFIGGGTPGQDTLWLRAFDGQWSGWTRATLTDVGVQPDTVTATDQSVAYQQSVALSSIFAVTVNGPTPPDQYQVWFQGPADGSVRDVGGAIATNTAVDETDLNSVSYIGGASAGQDRLWVRAFDGQWSSWTLATLSDPGVTPDTVTATDQSVAYQQSVGLGSIFAVSGATASKYQVWLAGPADGSVTDGSGAIATNTAVDETDLSSVNYIGGASAGQDQLWLRAFDGQWSSWTRATLTDPGVTPDTVTATDQSVGYQQSVGLGSIFAVSGATASKYQVWLEGSTDGSVTDGSGAIATNTAVDETDLSTVNYIGGAAAGQDRLWLRAFDGQWSAWALATLTDPGVTPPTVTPTQASQTVAPATVIAASSLFTTSNNSAAITQYGFWDLGTGGGGFTLNGTAQGTNQEIDVAAANLSQVNYVAGTGTDTLWVRANDGQWGHWSSAFTVTG